MHSDRRQSSRVRGAAPAAPVRPAPASIAPAAAPPAASPDTTNNPLNTALSAFSCEFVDSATERDFLSKQLSKSHAQLRLTLVAAAFIYLLFGLADLSRLGPGRDAYLSIGGRIIVALCAVASLVWMRNRPESVLVTRRVACAFEIVALASFMLVCAMRPTEMTWHAMALVIVILAIYIYIPNRYAWSLALALAGTAAFVWLSSVMGTLTSTEVLTAAALLLLANLFGAVAARRYERLWREDFCTQIALRSLAVHDALTGCYNRRHLHDALLENELARSQRYGLCPSVIMCDIDHFKLVNDTYGHGGGDQVLRAFGKLLKTSTRHNIDSVVRYGGEEFLLILPETDLAGSALVAERLRSAFAASSVLDEKERSISATASFGVAAVDFSRGRIALTQYALIARADELLYSAKHGGRNQVRSLQLD